MDLTKLANQIKDTVDNLRERYGDDWRRAIDENDLGWIFDSHLSFLFDGRLYPAEGLRMEIWRCSTFRSLLRS